MIKTVTLIQNITTDADSHYCNQALTFFKEHGIRVHLVTVESKDVPVVPEEAQSPDLAVVLGGDGTFLRAAVSFVNQQVALVGVNTGTLGFLTRIEADQMLHYLDLILKEEYEVQERMMLSVDHHNHAGTVHGQLALNDVVIKNANPSQLCRLALYINDTRVAVYDADGIILSTPTGTTAYNLSAGGPVLSPEVHAITITPICPHSFSAKAVVVPADKTIRVQSDAKNSEVLFALDGQETGILKPEESLQIFRSPIPLKNVSFRTEGDNFYLLLQRKLDWSINPRWKTGA